MTVISAPDLERLRNSHPHKIIPHLSVFKPEILYCGTVTGSPAMGARQITVVDVSGSLAAVDAALPDLMVYVGDACGDYSKSKRRLRSRSGQVLTLDENSVTWYNGDVITVVLSYDLWSVFPYINPSTKVFYKDYDIAYTDENEFMNPVAIMGPHQAKFLDGPTVTFNLVASDSYAVAQGASISSYAWTATGGSIANAADPTTTVTFSSPGQYIITLTVTDSNANTQATRRVYFVHQRTGANAPYSDFDFERSPEGDWDNGGWTCGISVRGDASQDEFPDNALCVLWAETFWNDEEYYIVDGYNILMVGYISRENIIKEMDSGSVSFDINTIHELMKRARCFSVSLEYNASPDTWWKMDDLTVGRAVHHMWRWHSTLFYITDVYLPILTSNTQLLKAVDDFEGGDLYSIVDNFSYQHSIFAHVACNKYGQVYVEQDVAMLDDADRAAVDVAVLLNDRDRRGPADLDFGRKTPEDVSHAIVSGTYFDGSQAYPVIAQAPGYVPSPWGENQASFERLVMSSQAFANMIAGRVIAVANGKIEDVSVPMAGNWLMALDIMPQNWIQLNLQATSNKRGLSLEGNYHLRRISSEISVENGTCLVDLNVIPEELSYDGVPGPYPDDYPWPNFPLPDLPEFPPWAFPSWNTLMVRNVWNDGIVNFNPWQGTVVNDPSSIFPVNDGDEVTNLLFSSSVFNSTTFVSDGISIFFHQWDGSWVDPTAYKFRIYRHDIETGAADYLVFPYDGGDAYFLEMTCIDINIVAVAVDTLVGGVQTLKLYEVNFNTGVVSEVYSYTDALIGSYQYFLTTQSTVNVYTLMQVVTYAGRPLTVDVHRYNWTTGASDIITVWTNPETITTGAGAGATPPIISGYVIYNWFEINSTSPRAKGYIFWINFATGESGSILIFHSGLSSPAALAFYHTAHYADLHRIYFVVRETFPYSNWYLYYVSTLTNETTYVRALTATPPTDEVYKTFYNKSRGWLWDVTDFPASTKLVDPYTSEERSIGTFSVDYGAYYYWKPPIWSEKIDDITDHIWSFQGHYIIGQSELYDNYIAETGITPPTASPTWDYRMDYLYILGRTFVVVFFDWNLGSQEGYAVHYPGSLVI